MRVLLINLPYYRFLNLRHRYYPVGLGYISSVLKQAGHEVLIYDMEKHKKEGIIKKSLKASSRVSAYKSVISASEAALHPLMLEAEEVVCKFRPDIIGISLWSTVSTFAVNLVHYLKAKYSSLVFVAGGIHATVCDRSLLESSDFDVAIRGEGEATFLSLVNSLSNSNDLSEVAGITYSDEGQIIRNPDRELIVDIDALPFPDKTNVWNSELLTDRELGCIVTSRGCPYKCSFCSSHEIWRRHVRLRSIKSVCEEVEFLYKRFKVSFITVFDDTFTLDKNRVGSFCDFLIEKKLSLLWFAHGRIDNMDDEYIKMLSKGKCYVMQFGVESGSPQMLKKMNKGIDLDRVFYVREKFKQYGILFWATFLIGNPDETEDDLKATYDTIERLKPDVVSVNTYVPYPGAEGWASFFEKRDDVPWHRYSPQSDLSSFSPVQKERFDYWRQKIGRLADKFNNRTQFSIKNTVRLFWPKFKTLMR